MSVGVVLLVHTALDRAEQVARHWAAAGCPVVIHVDGSIERAAADSFVARLSDIPRILFSRRHRCEWGGWRLVAATQDTSELMLSRFADVRHVYLASGACLPLRPVADLIDYLADRPRTDFIESATTADVPWTVGGLDQERFSLYFPFSWSRQRALFDRFVTLQRRMGVARRMPLGITPHMGSQWWCLTRQTLSAILQDPKRAIYDQYFRRVWIPDESYFQTLARRYSTQIESRSLTLSKFDFQGKPHIFYDDHLQLLRRSDCFVARKIWRHADRIYDTFLAPADTQVRPDPNPAEIDRLFAKAVDRRTRGRPGLYMQSRYPTQGWENGVTAGAYSVFHGFDEVVEDFQLWLARTTGAQVHGHLFAPDRVEFVDNQAVLNGALTNNPRLRDVNPLAFLTNLIWNMRGERQCFQYGPRDTPGINWHMARDPNAQIWLISGAWAVSLFHSNRNFADLRAEAARLQRIEHQMLDELRGPDVRATVRIWTLAEFIDAPLDHIQSVVAQISKGSPDALLEAPGMIDLTGFGQFLQNLKNQGMHPYLTGDFSVDPIPTVSHDMMRKPYLIKR